jgi:hypothetical protein
MIEILPKKPKDSKEYNGSMKYSAMYNCPDGKTLRLDGTCQLPDDPEMKLELRKVKGSMFPDEWDEVINGYYSGMNRKEVVDSVWAIVSVPTVSPEKATLTVNSNTGKPPPAKDPAIIVPVDVVKAPTESTAPPSVSSKNKDTLALTAKTTTAPAKPAPSPSKPAPSPSKPTPKPAAPIDITAEMAKANSANSNNYKPASGSTQSPVPTPEIKVTPIPGPPVSEGAPVPITGNINPDPKIVVAFASRKKVVQTQIPISGDTLELRFYDNAEVDGDSISLFINGVALFEHVRLQVRPYVLKIALNSLPEVSDLTMVAENLGTIPPNTAYMEAFVKGQRYSARLESTESISGVVRLVRKL